MSNWRDNPPARNSGDRRFKRESPLAAAIMVTHANGSIGYIPDDAACDQISYEIVVSPVQRGCAENAIVNGLLDMIDLL